MKAFALVALALVTLPPLASAEEEVVYPTYDQTWANVDDFSRCGWALLRAPFTASSQGTGPIDYLEAIENGATDPAIGVVRATTDKHVESLSIVEDDSYGNVARDFVVIRDYAKCLATRYMLWAANTFVWYNPPVACYLKDTAECGINTTVCQIVWPADLTIWALEWPPAGTPAPMPCLPPTDPACVPPADPLRCMPPTLPTPPEVLS